MEEHSKRPKPIAPDAPQPLFQEAGTRPSRALPYELHVQELCHSGERIALEFRNSGKQGVVFHVYDKLHLDRIPRRYTVEAGKSLSMPGECPTIKVNTTFGFMGRMAS